ncbi:MAG: hypothetical protein ILO36_01215 [Abditibacteriota bacterium]|nr:hypothetical protein [Abditibacteriota bacterium]
MDVSIDEIKAREILGLEGMPALEAEVILEDGTYGLSQVSCSGASSPVRENGAGNAAAAAINEEINNMLCGENTTDQLEIDNALRSVAELPAFARLAVSSACAKAAANALSLPLYRYLGGVFAHTIPMPEFTLLDTPEADSKALGIRPSGAACLAEAIAVSEAVAASVRDLLEARGSRIPAGENGGFASPLATAEENILLVCAAIERAGFIPGEDVELGLSFGAGFADNKYCSKARSAEDEAAYFAELCERFPVGSIDLPLEKSDAAGWQFLAEIPDGYVMLSCDPGPGRQWETPRLCPAPCCISRPEEQSSVSGILASLNAAAAAGKKIKIRRSSATEDTFIADLAVAVNAGYIAAGALRSPGSSVLLNQLLRIEEELGANGTFGPGEE